MFWNYALITKLSKGYMKIAISFFNILEGTKCNAVDWIYSIIFMLFLISKQSNFYCLYCSLPTACFPLAGSSDEDHLIHYYFYKFAATKHNFCDFQPPDEVRANFPKIDAVVLFGEPTKWETSLQLLIDVLLTNGKLTDSVCEFANGEPHLPILACNMDLLWMSESHMPR